MTDLQDRSLGCLLTGAAGTRSDSTGAICGNIPGADGVTAVPTTGSTGWDCVR
ncbi:MAG TPA: hypothetical protein VGP03_04605 [Pseudonocardiaceae bacterium]|nr:hypothetical protein [Pseudonocardiaceae bacterium]